MAVNDVLRSVVDTASLQNKGIERLRESVAEMKEAIAQEQTKLVASQDKLASSIEVLTIQVGHLSEGMTDLRLLSREILQAINQDRQNIAELVRLAQQQQTSIQLLSRQ